MRKQTKKKNKQTFILTRESAVTLGLRILALEILFILSIFASSTILGNLAISFSSKSQLFSIQFLLWTSFFVFKLVALFGVILRWANTSYEITKNGIKKRTGIIAPDEKTYQCNNIESVTLRQNILGKIANFGTIEIFSPLLNKRIFLTNVPHPKVCIKAIQQMIKDGNRSRGIIFNSHNAVPSVRTR